MQITTCQSKIGVKSGRASILHSGNVRSSICKLSAVSLGQQNSAGASATVIPSTRSKTLLPTLGLVSACVEVDADVRRFEEFAGRSAMIGFFVFLFTEGITDQGLFDNVSTEDFAPILGFILLLLTSSVVLMIKTRRKLGIALKDAVITSLTAAHRSGSSLSGAQVDQGVDYLFDSCRAFDSDTLYWTVMDEDSI